jgi:hypothetical protein
MTKCSLKAGELLRKLKFESCIKTSNFSIQVSAIAFFLADTRHLKPRMKLHLYVAKSKVLQSSSSSSSSSKSKEVQRRRGRGRVRVRTKGRAKSAPRLRGRSPFVAAKARNSHMKLHPKSQNQSRAGACIPTARRGPRAGQETAGTVARPTNSRSFFFDQTGRFGSQRLS